MSAKDTPLVAPKITTHHSDSVNLCKETCGQRKVRRRTAKDFVAFSKWCLKRIERDRTNYC
jgi:hypothetical protein